jgi:hypothetical protein
VDTTDVSKTAVKPAGAPAVPEKKGGPEKPKEKLGLGEDDLPGDETVADIEDEALEELTDDLPATNTVKVEVDKITVLPGALASGTVTFSDGVTGKWVVDQYGRPGFTEISQPGYRPTPVDSQAFMQELSAQLQKKGF